MSTHEIAAPAAGSNRSSATTRTRALLACGAVAGPLFIATVLIQALSRPGFDI